MRWDDALRGGAVGVGISGQRVPPLRFACRKLQPVWFLVFPGYRKDSPGFLEENPAQLPHPAALNAAGCPRTPSPTLAQLKRQSHSHGCIALSDTPISAATSHIATPDAYLTECGLFRRLI